MLWGHGDAVPSLTQWHRAGDIPWLCLGKVETVLVTDLLTGTAGLFCSCCNVCFQ